MSRVCQLTGKRTSVGNNVSHSLRHTKDYFTQIFWRNIKDPQTGVVIRLRLSAKAIKTLKKKGIL